MRFLLRNIFRVCWDFCNSGNCCQLSFYPAVSHWHCFLPSTVKNHDCFRFTSVPLPSLFLLLYMGQSMHHDRKLRWSVIIIIFNITMIIGVRLRRQFLLATRTWWSSPSTSPSSPSSPSSSSSPLSSECDYGGSAAWKPGHGHRPHHSLRLHKQSTLSGKDK